MSFDPKCYDLAEAFLQDEPLLNTDARRSHLAQVIQSVIEEEIADMREAHANPTRRAMSAIAAALAADQSPRLVPCEGCGSEGRLIRTKSGHPNDPDEIDEGECPVCGGAGNELIATSAVTLDDLEAMERV